MRPDKNPTTGFSPAIRALGVPFRVVGGAKEAAELNAVRAFDEGLRAAYELAGSGGQTLRMERDERVRGMRQWPYLRSRLQECLQLRNVIGEGVAATLR